MLYLNLYKQKMERKLKANVPLIFAPYSFGVLAILSNPKAPA